MQCREAVLKIEWWYDDAAHYYDPSFVSLALLRVFDDGRADVLTEDARTHIRFHSEEEANRWLVDEEFRRLQDLAEDWIERHSPVG